jgi:hypothetical protein
MLKNCPGDFFGLGLQNLDSVRKVMGLARAGLQNWTVLVYLKELSFCRRISETEILSGVVYSTDFFLVKILYI